MDDVQERIAAWEAEGLLDADTAARLRAAEASRAAERPAIEPARGRGGAFSSAGSFFGPGVALTEIFAYVGATFLLAAWVALIFRLIGEADLATGQWLQVLLAAGPAAALFVLGILLHGGTPRQGRAAGVCFYLSAAFVATGVSANASIFIELGAWSMVIGALAGLAAAAAYRWLHPSLLTQFAMISAIVASVGTWLEAVRSLISPDQVLPSSAGSGTLFVVTVLWVATWIVCAVVLGLIGLVESRSGTPDAGRRAALTRFFAGVVAVVGVAIAVMRTNYDDLGVSRRIVEPWLSELIVLIISIALVERAIRREASAYVFAGALGVVIALTDLNFTYFSPTGGVEVALLVEGLVLLAVAFGAERLSRRLGGGSGAGDVDVGIDDVEPEVTPQPAEQLTDGGPS